MAKRTKNLVGIDIDASSVTVAQASHRGHLKIDRVAYAPLESGIVRDGEVIDPEALATVLRTLFKENRGFGKRVRIGGANQKILVRVLELPYLETAKELEAAVRFQAQDQIPMPLDQAVLEYQVAGGVPAEEGAAPQVDVVVVAARREMIASFLEAARRGGLEPVGIDLSAFAMIRALAEAGEESPDAVLYCDVGDVTNLAVARGRSCLFTRVSSVGLEAISARLAAARGMTPEHAFQWLSYVGLEQPIETIEADPDTVAEARRALEDGAASLFDELRLSLDYYGAQEGALPVGRIVLSGAGSAFPGLGASMEERLGTPIQVARPSALA